MPLRITLSVACALALSACAAMTPEPRPTAVHPDAAALAELLVATGRADPDRIDGARPEMLALREALMREPASRAEPMLEQTSAQVLNAPGPAPDLSDGRSIMSAVHLASYRRMDHAGPGWRALQTTYPELLSGLAARVSQADLGDQGVFLRLKAGPLDSPDAARSLCARLQAAGLWCAPTDFNGDSLR